MLKTVISAFFIFGATLLPAQDVVVFSKYSESAIKDLEKLANATTEKELLELYKVNSVKALSTSLKRYAEASFSVDQKLPETCEAMVKKALADFKTKVESLSKAERIKQIPTLKAELEQALITALNKLEQSSLKPIFDSTAELEKEKNQNQSLFDALNTAEIESTESIVTKTLKSWKKNNNSAVLETQGEFIADIKAEALVKAEKNAEETFPFPNTKDLEQEALKKYRLFKVGDKVSIKYSPRPSQVLTASGQIRAMDAQKVKIGFNSVNIKDIVDPVIQDGMSKKKTLANRKKFIDDKILAIKKQRLKHFDDNLQIVADSLIKSNEAKGYVLYIGTWTPVAKVATAYVNTKAKAWKQQNADILEKAALADAKLIDEINSNTSNYRDFFSKSVKLGQTKLAEDAKQLLSEAELADDVGFTEEDLKKLEEEEAAKKKQAQEEAAKAAAAKRKAQQDAAKKKLELEKQRQDQEAASQNNMIMIGVALVLVGAVAFVAFNGKVRNKIFGKKKKSMHEVVSNLQGGAQDGSTPPLTVPGAGGPSGSMAPKPVATNENTLDNIEKTKINLDDGLSIERGGDEPAPVPAAAAAPRKKISLNLGGSTTSLSNESIDESEGKVSGGDKPTPLASGGLTPPGGGLTPPGGVLTPPGGGLTSPGGLTPPGGGLKAPGGLTPPGGGLTPPGGGLKPPGDSESNDDSSSSENSDKSNLIMNPNLNGSGDKLRLKK